MNYYVVRITLSPDSFGLCGSAPSVQFLELGLELLAVGVQSVGGLLQGTHTGLHLVYLVTVRLQGQDYRQRENHAYSNETYVIMVDTI